MKYVRGFGKFLFDFFIGDTPELFILGIAVLAIASALLHFLHAQALVIVLLPLMVFAGVVVSVQLERRRKRR
jgi:Na+/melibiose symporter-like transporter